MTDIDFDELDKAVSNLMGSVGKERTDDSPEEKTVNISTTLKPGEKPPYNKLDEVAKTIGSETLTTVTEQTLDTDKSAKTVDLGANPPSTPAPAPAQAAPVAPRPSNGRFMDVVHPSSDMKTVTASALASTPPPLVAETPAISTPAEAPTTPAPAVEPVPLTPFLPDAKVEKRPLGGVASTPDSDSTNEPVKAPEPLVESKEDQSSDEPATDISDKQKSVEPESMNIPEEARESVRSVESIDTENILAQSAAPQGLDTNPADDTKPGGIYDVNSYHQPLGHPEKQKSGWGVVVIIIVIIVLAAALGAAAYFILGLGV